MGKIKPDITKEHKEKLLELVGKLSGRQARIALSKFIVEDLDDPDMFEALEDAIQVGLTYPAGHHNQLIFDLFLDYKK